MIDPAETTYGPPSPAAFSTSASGLPPVPLTDIQPEESAIIDRATWDNLWVQICGRAPRPDVSATVVVESNPTRENWISGHFIGLSERPAAWFRAHEIHTPDGHEYDEEVVAGPDRPSQHPDWVPLHFPVAGASAAVGLFNAIHVAALHFLDAHEQDVRAHIPAKDAADLLSEILQDAAKHGLIAAMSGSKFKSEPGTADHLDSIARRLDELADEVEALDGAHIGGGTGKGIAQTLRGRSIILREVAKLRRYKQG